MDLVSSPTALKRWTLASLVSNMALIVTGGLVRVTQSGLGCSTWEAVRMPPEALTPRRPPTVLAMSSTAWTLAPPDGWKPVEVLTKSAPAASDARHAATISSSVRAAASMMTLTTVGAGAAARTAAISA